MQWEATNLVFQCDANMCSCGSLKKVILLVRISQVSFWMEACVWEAQIAFPKKAKGGHKGDIFCKWTEILQPSQLWVRGNSTCRCYSKTFRKRILITTVSNGALSLKYAHLPPNPRWALPFVCIRSEPGHRAKGFQRKILLFGLLLPSFSLMIRLSFSFISAQQPSSNLELYINPCFIHFMIHCKLKRILFWKSEFLPVAKDPENPFRGKILVKVTEDKKHPWLCLFV